MMLKLIFLECLLIFVSFLNSFCEYSCTESCIEKKDSKWYFKEKESPELRLILPGKNFKNREIYYNCQNLDKLSNEIGYMNFEYDGETKFYPQSYDEVDEKTYQNPLNWSKNDDEEYITKNRKIWGHNYLCKKWKDEKFYTLYEKLDSEDEEESMYLKYGKDKRELILKLANMLGFPVDFDFLFNFYIKPEGTKISVIFHRKKLQNDEKYIYRFTIMINEDNLYVKNKSLSTEKEKNAISIDLRQY